MTTPKGMTVRYLKRDHTEINTLPNLRYTINRYSFESIGGPKEATIAAFGSDKDLWQLINMLRFNVQIINDKGEKVWWGYISEITIRVGNIKFGVSLDDMYNRVAVAYTSFGERKTTSWANNNLSTGEYGTKEILVTVSDATESEADTRRDAELENRKIPVPTIDFQGQTEGSLSAEIRCRGWYETLGWGYYSQAKGLVQHANSGVGTQSIGATYTSACLDFVDTTISDWNEGLSSFKKGAIVSINGSDDNDGNWTVSQGTSTGSSIETEENLTDGNNDSGITIYTASKIAQKFYQNSGSAWDASYVHIRAQTTGSPADFLRVVIQENTGGVPGNGLASGSIAASDVGETMIWHEIPLSSCATLANGTEYFLKVERTDGATTTASSHYKIDVDEGLGYSDVGEGTLLLSTEDGWVERPTDAHMLFKVVGTQPVTVQIKETANTAGQFLSGVTIRDASTVETNQYRDGETTALTEINELLKVGTANKRRLLCEITNTRRLVITEEPARSRSTDYKMRLDGSIQDEFNESVPKHKCTIGKWVRITDFQPATFDRTLIANPTLFFIEEADYYVQGDQYTPRSKNTDSYWNIGNIKDG